MKARELGSTQHEGVVGVAPEEESAGEVAASGAMHDVPGAEHASGGEIKSGGQSSRVSAGGGPTEPTAASTTCHNLCFYRVPSVRGLS
jgi:hypothetical protein